MGKEGGVSPLFFAWWRLSAGDIFSKEKIRRKDSFLMGKCFFFCERGALGVAKPDSPSRLSPLRATLSYGDDYSHLQKYQKFFLPKTKPIPVNSVGVASRLGSRGRDVGLRILRALPSPKGKLFLP